MTKAQAAAAIQIVFALSEAVRDLGEVPAGTLYAASLDKLSLEDFEAAVGILTRSGVVRRDGDLLVWNAKPLS